MKKSEIRYKPELWLHWGEWRMAMIFTSTWMGFERSRIFKELDLGFFKGNLKILRGNFYYLKSDHNRLSQFIRQNIDTDWFERFFKLLEQNMGYIRSLEDKSDIKLFIMYHLEYLAGSSLVEFTDLCIGDYLKEVCDQRGVSFADVAASMNPPKNTLLMQYNQELKVLNKSDIKSFVEKYRWVGTHGFEGDPLTEDQVLIELEQGQKEPERIDAPEGFERLIEIGSWLAYYRSQLIEVFDQVCFSYWPKLKDLGEKHNLSFQEVISLSHVELCELIDDGKIPDKLKERGKDFGVIYKDGELIILDPDEAEKELEIHQEKIDPNITEVRGLSANKGHVKGVVKIIHMPEDIKKVNEGDIILASETQPFFVPAMGKAAAFVTDIGGLTSHAAITSREMNKPCIIGTKIATRVFKDGDLVEVDADRGIVKKLLKQ